MREVAAVVLAAGGSRRMGVLKQLLPAGRGEGGTPLLRQVVGEVLGGGFDQVVVVVGCQAEQVRGALEGLPVTVVVNEGWEQGLSSSVRCGLDALGPEIQAAVFVPGDQPGVTAGLLRSLVCAHRESGACIVAPAWEGRWGNPVLFDRALFGALEAQTGDKGGRDLVRQHWDEVVLVPAEESALRDLDTPEDYRRWLKGQSGAADGWGDG